MTAKKRAKKATPAPEEFEITDDMRSWFRVNFGQVSERQVLAETDKFLDHHRAKGTLFKDWRAAWRNWMRNWRTDFGKRAPVAGPRSDRLEW